MIPVTIISVGAIKEKSILALCQQYQKRLSPYVRLNLVEVQAQPFSSASLPKAQATEEQAISRRLEKISGDIYLLSEDGEMPGSSVDFSRDIVADDGKEKIFIIGGASGFSAGFKARYRRLSLSPLTFTHEMARLILLEQLYRSIAILSGKQYHY